jgi:hypothetical protein
VSADDPTQTPAVETETEGSIAPPGMPAADQIAPPPELAAVPEDANDTRGMHFRRLARHPATLILGGIGIGAALIGGAAAGSIAIGAAAAGGVVLLALLIVWLLASGRAADDFFRAYADGRNLRRTDGKSQLPPVTPLLSKGDRRYAEQRFDGVLPGGLDGSLCLYTYEEETRDSDGNRQTTYIHHTIAMTQLPDTAPFIQELFCNRRFGFRFMDSMEDVFRKRQRVEHESEAVDKEFEIFCGERDDMNRARQILSPTFLVWLEQNSPEQLAFELVAGSLVTNVKGHKKSAAELDLLCTAAAAIARRLHEEATELTSTAPPPADPNAPPH